MTRNAYRLLSAAAVVAAVLVGGGCGDDDQTPVDASESAAPATGDESDDDVLAFCEAVEALDRTDGTTDSAIVVAAIEDLRKTAPGDIREDVTLLSDHMVVSDFPDAADPSMEQASYEERIAASGRLAAYAEDRC